MQPNNQLKARTATPSSSHTKHQHRCCGEFPQPEMLQLWHKVPLQLALEQKTCRPNIGLHVFCEHFVFYGQNGEKSGKF